MSRRTTYRDSDDGVSTAHRSRGHPASAGLRDPGLPAASCRQRGAGFSPAEQCLRLVTSLRPGEGKSVVLFFSYAFLLLICYYVLKTIREPLLLTEGSAELKSYAYAVIALVLLVMVPLYGFLFRRIERRRLIRRITTLFGASLVLFYFLGRAGHDVGFVYYVWVGVVNVTMIAQFWAHAANSYSTESGQRLFPAIMGGAALGALAGPSLSSALYQALGPWNLMAIAIVLLAATLPLVEWTWRSVPADSSTRGRRVEPEAGHLLGGFALVMRDRYLQLLAVLTVLLNCVNTTGEYILTTLVIEYAGTRVAEQPGLETGEVIAAFFGHYYLAVNALTVVLQVCLVARIFRWIGVQGALLILPVVALIGYGLVVFLPIFSVVRAVKIFENSTNYSIMNTARHALYLPLPTGHQFEGKTAVDTFFWRLGDVVQAAVIYIGLNWLDFEFQQFAMLNMVLALVWILIALRLGRLYPTPRPRVEINWRAVAPGVATAALAVAAFTLPVPAATEPTRLFSDGEPLIIELLIDMRSICRDEGRKGCNESSATIVYDGPDGAKHSVAATVRARGNWRKKSGNCSMPPLFVFFGGDTAGTLFEGQTMLPLTTHCREKPRRYEQYVIKEYLAYRIYNLLTDKSLRARLARVTYRDTGRRDRSVERYAFFTEHFESLAARHESQLWHAKEFRPQADPEELALFELFQYSIGNTDWSALEAHNVTYLREPSGRVTAVPYDFDFAGLVDAAYAEPSPKLPIRRVTQRLFRGLCRPDLNWAALFAHMQERRHAVMDLIEQVPGLEAAERTEALAYLGRFFQILDSPQQRKAGIVDACRGTGSTYRAGSTSASAAEQRPLP